MFSKHILFLDFISHFVLHLVRNSFVFCILNSTKFATGLYFAFSYSNYFAIGLYFAFFNPPGLRQVNLRLDVLLLALLKKCRALKNRLDCQVHFATHMGQFLQGGKNGRLMSYFF